MAGATGPVSGPELRDSFGRVERRCSGRTSSVWRMPFIARYMRNLLSSQVREISLFEEVDALANDDQAIGDEGSGL